MSKRLSIGLRVRNVLYDGPDVAIVCLYNGIETVVAAENGKAPLDAPFATDPFDGTGAFRYDEALGAWRYVGVTGGGVESGHGEEGEDDPDAAGVRD